MKIEHREKYRIYVFFLLMTFLVAVGSSVVAAKDDVPIPPKRPKILNVSPAYIEELRSRSKVVPSKHKKEESFSGDKKNEVDTDVETNIETKIADVNENDLVDILKQRKLPQDIEDFIPVPLRKPVLIDIEPAAGRENNEKNTTTKDNNEITLISFVLNARQISLDRNLETFLKERAINLFNEDKNLKMEIHAYATPVEGEPYSDVRISLARALEVRSFLIDNDVAPERLELSPMGENERNISDDRIDLIFIKTN